MATQPAFARTFSRACSCSFSAARSRSSRRLPLVLLSLATLALTGCGTLTGLPAHGGGKRFATEQRLVSASIRSALMDIDVTALKGRRAALIFDLVADEGGGSFNGGRWSPGLLFSVGTLTSPVTTTTNAFQVYNLAESGSSYSNTASGGGSLSVSTTLQNGSNTSTGTSDTSGSSTNSSAGSATHTSSTTNAGTSTTSGSSTSNSTTTNTGSSAGSSTSTTGGTTTNTSFNQSDSSTNATNGAGTSTSTTTNAGTSATNGSSTNTSSGTGTHSSATSSSGAGANTSQSTTTTTGSNDGSSSTRGGYDTHRQEITPSPTESVTQTQGTKREHTATLAYRGLGEYQNFPVPKSDASLLMGLVRSYLLLNGVTPTTPNDPTAEVLVYVTVDIFGTVRSRFDALVYNNETVKAETSFELMAFDREGQLILRPQVANREARYREHYLLWTGPITSQEHVYPGDGLLVDFTQVDGRKGRYNKDVPIERDFMGGKN